MNSDTRSICDACITGFKQGLAGDDNNPYSAQTAQSKAFEYGQSEGDNLRDKSAVTEEPPLIPINYGGLK